MTVREIKLPGRPAGLLCPGFSTQNMGRSLVIFQGEGGRTYHRYRSRREGEPAEAWIEIVCERD